MSDGARDHASRSKPEGQTPVGPGSQQTTAGPTPVIGPGSPILPAIPGYEILGFIGSGGQGDVYRARHVGLDRTVALKVLRDSHGTGQEQLARFRREGQVIARLNHPNIVGVYGFDEAGGRFFLSMEYLAGGSLKDRLSRDGLFAPQAAVELLLTLVPAVEHAHQKGIVHRDLKPGNVLFTLEGQPKIVDFGVAKVLGEAPDQQTRTGAVLGSPSYMAPEQAAGKISQVGPATDVYALGAILYELLAGRPPFVGESWLDTLDRVRFQPVEPPSRWRRDLPANLEQICLKCLAKAPDARIASAAQLGAALQEVAGAPTPAAQASAASVIAVRQRFVAGTDDRLRGGYQLLRLMHAGASGELWYAAAPGGIKVALKIHYQPNDANAHHQKALDLVKNLNHPYLLKTHAYWVDDGRLHVAMELAEGSLHSRLKRARRQKQSGLPAQALVSFVQEAAEALDYLHGQGLVHRNIAPDNLLLLKGHVKIGDFSRVCADGTCGDAAGGALGYMAPECYQGSATCKSDQYSLAISYAELRRGRRPFPARTTLHEAMRDALEENPDLGDLDKSEKTVLRQALAKDAAARYPSCREFAAALSAAVPSE